MSLPSFRPVVILYFLLGPADEVIEMSVSLLAS